MAAASEPQDSERVANILEELRNGRSTGLNELTADLGEAGQLVAAAIRISVEAEDLARRLPPAEARVLLERISSFMDMVGHALPDDA